MEGFKLDNRSKHSVSFTPLSTLYNSLILKGLKFNNFLAKNCKPSIYRALEKRVESQVKFSLIIFTKKYTIIEEFLFFIKNIGKLMINWLRFTIELIICLIIFSWLPIWLQIGLSVIFSISVDIIITKYNQYRLVKKINERIK